MLNQYGASFQEEKERAEVIREAIRMRNVDCVMILLTFNYGNTKRFQNGQTPLMLAIASGLYDVVPELFKKTSDFNSSAQNTGDTALHLLINNKQLDLTQQLIQHSEVKYDIKYQGGTYPIHWACATGIPEFVQLIIHKTTADVFAKTDSLEDAIFITLKNPVYDKDPRIREKNVHNILEILEMLVRKGVDVNNCRRDGTTAIQNYYTRVGRDHDIRIVKFIFDSKLNLGLMVNAKGETLADRLENRAIYNQKLEKQMEGLHNDNSERKRNVEVDDFILQKVKAFREPKNQTPKK